MIPMSNRSAVILLTLGVVFSASFVGGGAAAAYLFDEESTDASVEFIGAIPDDIVQVDPNPIVRGSGNGSITVYADVPAPDHVDESLLSLEVGDEGERIDARNAECRSRGDHDWNCMITFDRADLLALTDGVGTVDIVLHGQWQTGGRFTGTYDVTIVDPSERHVEDSTNRTTPVGNNQTDPHTTDTNVSNVTDKESPSDDENVTDDSNEGGNKSDTSGDSIENESDVGMNQTDTGDKNETDKRASDDEIEGDSGDESTEEGSDDELDVVDEEEDSEEETDVEDEEENEVDEAVETEETVEDDGQNEG